MPIPERHYRPRSAAEKRRDEEAIRQFQKRRARQKLWAEWWQIIKVTIAILFIIIILVFSWVFGFNAPSWVIEEADAASPYPTPIPAHERPQPWATAVAATATAWPSWSAHHASRGQ